MTDAAGKELYQNLISRRLGKRNFVDDQWLVGFHQDRRPTFNAHASLLKGSALLLRPRCQKLIDGAVHFRGPLGEGKVTAALKFQILRTLNGLMNFQLVLRR